MTNEDLVLRPRPVPAYFFGGFALLCGILLLLGRQQPAPARSLVIVGSVFAILALVTLVLFGRTSITITGSGIVYRNPFRTTAVEWRRVIKTYIVHRHRGKAAISDWHFETADGGKTRFSVKFYSVSGLSALARAVVASSGTAIADDRIHTLADGRIPWRPRLFS